MSESEIDSAVRRTVGVAALRRLRAMVDAERAQNETDTRWAGRIGWVLVLAAALGTAWLAFR
jgi:hypothetical protein